jgi:DNA-binding response OmpR family regulator
MNDFANLKRILVVDDDEYVTKLLQRILIEAVYDVVTAISGKEALDKLTGASIDLVLLDIKMPGLDGFQTLAMIRKQSNIPVIMVTGIAEVTSVNEAFNLGADDYITKPFRTGELLARINAKLRRAGPNTTRE